jgi:hypothetical protein
MNFYFGEKSNQGVSVLYDEKCYKIYIPEYLKSQISFLKISNWVKELGGEMQTNLEIFVPLKLRPSDIYYSYYHFVE